MEETEVGGSQETTKTVSSQHLIDEEDQTDEDNLTNSSSTVDEMTKNNSENSNTGAAGAFGLYTTGNGFFDFSSKTTVAYATNPHFPLSREEATKVTNERSVVLVDGVQRKINGKYGLDVKVPLFLKDKKWLMYIYGTYKGELLGILYDPISGKVSCSTKSLSTICSNADADAKLDSSEVAKMDQACMEFFTAMRFQDEEISEGGKKLSWHYVSFLLLISMFFIIITELREKFLEAQQIDTQQQELKALKKSKREELKAKDKQLNVLNETIEELQKNVEELKGSLRKSRKLSRKRKQQLDELTTGDDTENNSDDGADTNDTNNTNLQMFMQFLQFQQMQQQFSGFQQTTDNTSSGGTKKNTSSGGTKKNTSSGGTKKKSKK